MKTETKGTHTPGPWTVDEDLARERRVISGAENEVVAEVIGSEDAWDPADTDRLDDERDANARLIAAAPELRDYVESIVAWGIAPDSTPATIADIVAEARALLARIDGD